jgi:hypothetical protein
LDVDYCIVAVDVNGTPTGQWESGDGIFSFGGQTWTRVTVHENSLGTTALINFSAGTKWMMADYSAKHAVASLIQGASADAPTFGTMRVNGSPWVDVMSPALTRRFSGSLTTTTGSIGSGTNSLTVASALSFVNGNGIWVVLDNGTVFTSYITAGGGTTSLTLNDNAPSAATAKNVGHDETLAIQAACDAGGASSKILAPNGFYFVSTIKLNDHQQFEGCGMGTLFVSIPGNSNAGIFQLKATTNTGCAVRNLRISGGKTQTPQPSCAHLQFDNTGTVATDMNMIQNVQCVSGAAGGFSLKSQVQTIMSNISIQTTDGIGVKTDSLCFNLMVNGLLLDNLGLHALEENGKFNTWAGLMIEQGGNVNHSTSGDGIHCTGTGNFFSGFIGYNLRHGVHIDGGSGNLFYMQFFANGGYHVQITSGNDNYVHGSAALTASGSGDQNLALGVLNIIAGTKNTIRMKYSPAGLIANSVVFAGTLTGNTVELTDGAMGGASGELNVFESAPLVAPPVFKIPGILRLAPGAVLIQR